MDVDVVLIMGADVVPTADVDATIITTAIAELTTMVFLTAIV